MEPDFSLLERVWCVAELVEANELHLNQAETGGGCFNKLDKVGLEMCGWPFKRLQTRPPYMSSHLLKNPARYPQMIARCSFHSYRHRREAFCFLQH